MPYFRFPNFLIFQIKSKKMQSPVHLGRSFLFDGPEPNLLFSSWPEEWALTELACDNMMTTAKAVDFPSG
jgi:hypothetical protein